MFIVFALNAENVNKTNSEHLNNNLSFWIVDILWTYEVVSLLQCYWIQRNELHLRQGFVNDYLRFVFVL